jgi:hypothetical protein
MMSEVRATFWQTEAGSKTLGGSPKSSEPRQVNTFKVFYLPKNPFFSGFLGGKCLFSVSFAKTLSRIVALQRFWGAGFPRYESRYRD